MLSLHQQTQVPHAGGVHPLPQPPAPSLTWQRETEAPRLLQPQSLSHRAPLLPHQDPTAQVLLCPFGSSPSPVRSRTNTRSCSSRFPSPLRHPRSCPSASASPGRGRHRDPAPPEQGKPRLRTRQLSLDFSAPGELLRLPEAQLPPANVLLPSWTGSVPLHLSPPLSCTIAQTLPLFELSQTRVTLRPPSPAPSNRRVHAAPDTAAPNPPITTGSCDGKESPPPAEVHPVPAACEEPFRSQPKHGRAGQAAPSSQYNTGGKGPCPQSIFWTAQVP